MKRKKKYDVKKSLKRDLSDVTRKICYAFLPGLELPETFTIQGDRINVPNTVSQHIFGHAYHWTVHLLVFCKPIHAKPYFKEVIVNSKGPMIHRSLLPDLNDEHTKLINSVSDDQLMCAAYILVPHYEKVLLDESVVDKIFDTLGAWKFKSGIEWAQGL